MVGIVGGWGLGRTFLAKLVQKSPTP